MCNKCPNCKSEHYETNITNCLTASGGRSVTNLPRLICLECGTMYVDSKRLQECIEELLRYAERNLESIRRGMEEKEGLPIYKTYVRDLPIAEAKVKHYEEVLNIRKQERRQNDIK